MRARTIPRKSPFTRVTPALSMATSVPVPGHEAAFALKLFYHAGLVLRQDLCDYSVNVELSRHSLGCSMRRQKCWGVLWK